jgi:phosphoribosylcarboxyaminoimidazole (NCAIR) mutase
MKQIIEMTGSAAQKPIFIAAMIFLPVVCPSGSGAVYN